MLKKLTAVLLSALIVVLSIPAVRSAATDVTVEGTLGDVLYGYTSDDLLSIDNYLDYFTVPDDKLYLKFDAQYQRLTNNDSTEFGYTFWDNIKTYWDSNIDTGLKQVEFPNHTGYKLFYWWYTGNNFTCQTLVVDTQGVPVIINGRLACTEQFDLYYNQYLISSDFSSYSVYPNQSTYSGVVTGSQNGNYYYFNLDTNRQCMYSEIPYLMSYYSDNNYPDGAFLSQSPYNYNDFVNVLNAYYNNTDDTGFVIDRRTSKMINGEDEEEGIINDADLLDFQGELGFESFVFKGYIDKNADLVFPSYVINYKYNNYSDLRKENVLLYIDINFDFKLTFNMAGGTVGYQSANMQNMSIEDITDNRNAYGGDINALIGQSRFINIRETSGLHLQSNDIVGYEDISQYQSSSLIANLGRYFYKIMQNSSANHVVNSKRDSYFYIDLDFYLVDNTDGIYQESKHIKRRIDYWGDTNDPNSILKSPAINDIDNSGIIDDDEAFQNFIDSYNSNNSSEDSGYIDYLPSVNNGGSTSSVGNITINQNPYPYLLVDIPEGEWMSKTPNLTTILTDFKDALSEVKDNSILNVMSETYNYLPAPVWQYFTYGVGILIAIGIWRAITRR